VVANLGLQVWADLSASGMKALRLPNCPGDLVIAPDGDAAGHSAVQALAQRAYATGVGAFRFYPRQMDMFGMTF